MEVLATLFWVAFVGSWVALGVASWQHVFPRSISILSSSVVPRTAEQWRQMFEAIWVRIRGSIGYGALGALIGFVTGWAVLEQYLIDWTADWPVVGGSTPFAYLMAGSLSFLLSWLIVSVARLLRSAEQLESPLKRPRNKSPCPCGSGKTYRDCGAVSKEQDKYVESSHRSRMFVYGLSHPFESEAWRFLHYFVFADFAAGAVGFCLSRGPTQCTADAEEIRLGFLALVDLFLYAPFVVGLWMLYVWVPYRRAVKSEAA